MRVSEYITTNNLFEFDSLKCIRNDYYYNNCRKCIDICPKEYFSVANKKLLFDSQSCISCSACIGGCPSESLCFIAFDQNRFILEFKFQKDTTLSCKSNTPCLAIFSVEHLISAVLRKKEDIFLELGECIDCEISIENKITDEYKRQSGLKVPFKLTILKNSLKLLDNFKAKISQNYTFAFSKRIEKGCNNCKECVQFCPTEALFFSSDFSQIFFTTGKCIGCQICNDICKENVVKNVE